MNAKTTQKPASKPADGTVEILVGSTKVTADTKVSYVANPKRKNSAAWERYEKYQTAATIGEYMSLNPSKHARADLRHDLSKGFLTIDK